MPPEAPKMLRSVKVVRTERLRLQRHRARPGGRVSGVCPAAVQHLR